METQYVYLIQTSDFFKLKEPVYRVGRITMYPYDSVLLFQSSCSDCCKLEQKIIRTFTQKYKNRPLIGKEYFEGNYCEMIRDLCDIVKNEEHKSSNTRELDIEAESSFCIPRGYFSRNLVENPRTKKQPESETQSNIFHRIWSHFRKNKVQETNIIVQFPNTKSLGEDVQFRSIFDDESVVCTPSSSSVSSKFSTPVIQAGEFLLNSIICCVSCISEVISSDDT